MRKLLILSDCGTNVPHLTDEFEVLALPQDADAALRMREIADAEVVIGEPSLFELSAAKKLKWVQMTWAGADRYLRGGFPKGVLLTTATGAFGETIAEHALAMLFSLCRRLSAYQKAGTWQDLGREKRIAGSTALIFGCGNIGTEIAKRLKALGVHTVGVCRAARQPRTYFEALTTLFCADAFLPEADFILCALPSNAETEQFFDETRLTLCKNDSVLINVGRGSLIDLNCLTNLLNEGKFFGVGLDVTEPEPLPPEHPLWTMPNVILTPHIAGVSFGHLPETEESIWAICRENLQNYLAGKPLRNAVRLP
ncbi:MAG: D-2-hydroxyacid dehydrogenase [Clostridia bacterium]|nr:D-2-hydroxyacid dehydrogenase [Oscillospiraceae bacterium]MBQ3763256.1 D-2-hydroxyacid dehydrogenase [Clostridia bacterium]